MQINWFPKRDCFIEGKCPNGRAWIRLGRNGQPDSYYLILDGVKTKQVAWDDDSVADIKRAAEDEYLRFLVALELSLKNNNLI